MGILLKTELVEKVIEKIISNIDSEECVKNYIRQGAQPDIILKFFLDGVTQDAARKLKNDLLKPQVTSQEDVVNNVILIAKAEILKSVVKSVVKMKGISANLSDEEKINLLIDLKNTADLNEVESIIADTLEIDLKL